MASSGYTAWSVTFGEQPTATKWNLLGSNDSAFNLGTGFEDGVIINRHLATNAVGAANLATNAIKLGYAQITSSFNITASQTTPQQVTGLSAAVTIPAGGRSVKITAFAFGMLASGIANTVLSIWDGAVNSGTRISGSTAVSGTSGWDYPACAIAVVTPAAGAKTYNVGFNCTTLTNVSLEALATTPAFILVEAI